MVSDELQTAVAEYEVLRAQLEALSQQNDLLQMSLEEHMRARETMKRFREGGEGAEILVPIGADSYLFARIKEPNKALVGIGSDLSMEEDMDTALKRLDRKIERIQVAVKKVEEKIFEVSKQVEKKSGAVRELIDKAQGGRK